MQDKLKEKWAVEITSPEDAERLQKLFPHDTDIMAVAINGNNRYNGHYYMDKQDGLWSYSDRLIYDFEGYTIYTITELENLMK